MLELGKDAGGARWFLSGRPVHAGAAVDLQMHDGVWLSGRLEFDWNEGKPVPLFFTFTRNPAAQEARVFASEVSFVLPKQAVLRWPIPVDRWSRT